MHKKSTSQSIAWILDNSNILKLFPKILKEGEYAIDSSRAKQKS
jgi:hypothetical protein